jgi:hypothetical protein
LAEEYALSYFGCCRTHRSLMLSELRTGFQERPGSTLRKEF